MKPGRIARDVQELRIGVRVHRQIHVALTHCGLGGAWRNAPLTQQRPEGVPHDVHVHRPPAFVPLGDAGELQVL